MPRKGFMVRDAALLDRWRVIEEWYAHVAEMDAKMTPLERFGREVIANADPRQPWRVTWG